jgi:Holliday junction resolvasome RuvABC endonuclease subunit
MLQDIKILAEKQWEIPIAKIWRAKIEPPFPLASFNMIYGFDPGTVNLGIAFSDPHLSMLQIMEITMVRDDDAVQRILNVQRILSHCCTIFSYRGLATIEGAAFGNNFRQVELAEQRASIVLWCNAHGIAPKIVAPSSIRKKVLGGGKIKAEKYWENIPPNAASALACMYYQNE